MASRSLKVLLVEDNPGDVRLVNELLSGQTAVSFTLSDVGDLAGAEELLKLQSYDAILLDLFLPDSGGPESIERIRGVAPSCPVVVLTGTEDEATLSAAFQAGAQDYLVKGSVNTETLSRTIRHATERLRLSRQLEDVQAVAHREREWSTLERMAAPQPAQATAASYGERSLEDASPEVWELLIVEYVSLLESSLEERTFRGRGDRLERVRSMGQRLGSLRAMPRDVAKIHVAAVKRASAPLTPAKTTAVTEEGRLLLIEVMGHLVVYYRTFMGPVPYSRSPRNDHDRISR